MQTVRQSVLVVLVLAGCCAAQEAAAPEDGMDTGNYHFQQSVEFGYRYRSMSGNESVFDTFVNQNSGLRLLEQSLTVHSLNHQGLLFDDLSLSSIGYGGDPNQVSRLRVGKNRWYNFKASFRRDQNDWDYNLLANPLNPPTSSPSLPILQSPHRLELIRSLGDYNLTVLPQSRVRLRLGYTHEASSGPSFTSFHEGLQQGVETLIFQPYRETQNSYQIGIDIKLLPRTNLSLVEFLQENKGDTSWLDQNFSSQLANGNPADLGLVFATPFTPCLNPLQSTATTPPTANPQCNAFLSYARNASLRTPTATERMSLQSSYWKHVEVSALFSYSNSTLRVPNYVELFQGFIVPTQQRQDNFSALSKAERINVTADAGITWMLTDKFRISGSFHWQNFRIPGSLNSLDTALFAASLLDVPNAYNPAVCTAPFTSPLCPQHGFGSTADLIATQAAQFLSQSSSQNLLNFEYDLAPRTGVRLGYRYARHNIREVNNESDLLTFLPPIANRGDCQQQPLQAGGSCVLLELTQLIGQTIVNQNALLVGMWSRPLRSDVLRLNADAELMTADNTYTRVDARQRQKYRLRTSYKPAPWAQLGGVINWREERNNVTGVNYLGHSRSFSFNAALAPSERFGVELNYDYNSVFTRMAVCYISSGLTGVPELCQTDLGLFGTTSFYDSATQFGGLDLRWKPTARLTTRVGYAMTHVNGDTLFLNALMPFGSLRYNYYQPNASVAYELRKGLTWRAQWGYYGYGENSAAWPTSPRDFHAHTALVALRYSF